MSVEQYTKYKNTIDNLITVLSGRFDDFRQLEGDLVTLSNLFDTDPFARRAEIQLELIELHSAHQQPMPQSQREI